MPAQNVGNAAFANKLNRLLDHAIPAVDVAHVDTAAVFLDAREPQEFRVSHIKNARSVGYDEAKRSPKNLLMRVLQMSKICMEASLSG